MPLMFSGCDPSCKDNYTTDFVSVQSPISPTGVNSRGAELRYCEQGHDYQPDQDDCQSCGAQTHPHLSHTCRVTLVTRLILPSFFRHLAQPLLVLRNSRITNVYRCIPFPFRIGKFYRIRHNRHVSGRLAGQATNRDFSCHFSVLYPRSW